MGYQNAQKIYPYAATGAIDLGTNVAHVWLPAEDMIVYGWGIHITEATHTATVTTAAVVTFAYDAANAGTPVAKGTVSAGVLQIIGKEISDVALPPFKVTGGSDALEWTLTTDISATTTTGTAVPFVYAEVFPALTGA